MCQESQKALVKRVHFGTLLKHLDAKPHIMKAKPPPAAAPPAMAIPLLTIEVGSSTCYKIKVVKEFNEFSKTKKGQFSFLTFFEAAR